jgi:hypothetical protein
LFYAAYNVDMDVRSLPARILVMKDWRPDDWRIEVLKKMCGWMRLRYPYVLIGIDDGKGELLSSESDGRNLDVMRASAEGFLEGARSFHGG